MTVNVHLFLEVFIQHNDGKNHCFTAVKLVRSYKQQNTEPNMSIW